MLFGKLPYSVLIVSSGDKGADLISAMLDADSFAPVHSAKSGASARKMMSENRFDVVIINAPLSDEFGNELAVSALSDGAYGAILIVKNELFDETSKEAEKHGVYTVAKPLSKHLFYRTTQLVAAACSRLSRTELENNRQRVSVEEIKLVERAKCTLIEVLNMSEAQAHRYIEKQAMDMRMTKKEVALGVLRTYSNLTN